MTTSPLSPEDVRIAAEVQRELGPEYSDAVVASFFEKVDGEIAERIEARLAGMGQTRDSTDFAVSDGRGALLKGMTIGAVGVGVPFSLIVLWTWHHAPSSPGSRVVAVWLITAVILTVAAAGSRLRHRVRRQRQGRITGHQP